MEQLHTTDVFQCLVSCNLITRFASAFRFREGKSSSSRTGQIKSSLMSRISASGPYKQGAVCVVAPGSTTACQHFQLYLHSKDMFDFCDAERKSVMYKIKVNTKVHCTSRAFLKSYIDHLKHKII